MEIMKLARDEECKLAGSGMPILAILKDHTEHGIRIYCNFRYFLYALIDRNTVSSLFSTASFPYLKSKEVTLINITIASGEELRANDNPFMFKDVKIRSD